MRREELNMKEKELHVGICFPENLKIMVKGKKKKLAEKQARNASQVHNLFSPFKGRIRDQINS